MIDALMRPNRTFSYLAHVADGQLHVVFEQNDSDGGVSQFMEQHHRHGAGEHVQNEARERGRRFHETEDVLGQFVERVHVSAIGMRLSHLKCLRNSPPS